MEYPIPCRTIARHFRCHFDEVVGRRLFQMYGDIKFPGASKAELIYWMTGDTPDGRRASAWEEEGVIAIGVGHSHFDEHSPAGVRIPGECAATLVAHELDLMGKPELQKLLRFTLATDENPAQHPFDVSGILKVIHKRHPENPEIGESWAVTAIDAILDPEGPARAKASRLRLAPLATSLGITKEPFDKLVRFVTASDERGALNPQHPFDLAAVARLMPETTATPWLETAFIALRDGLREFGSCAVEFARNAHITKVPLPGNGFRWPLAVVAIESENERIAAFGRSDQGCNAAIVIQKHPDKGTVQIFTDHRRVSQELMDRIAKTVLRAEGYAGGNQGKWYYHKKARALLNGSSTHPDVEPTLLSLERITYIVVNIAKNL